MMESEIKALLPVFFAISLGAVVLLIVFLLFSSRRKSEVQQRPKNKNLNTKDDKSSAHSEKKKETIQSGKTKKKVVDKRWRNDLDNYSHPWLLTTFKGHTGAILDIDFSSNGKYLVSCGDDRAVFIWEAKDFTQRDRKTLRVNIDFDFATLVKWSPDSKAFIVHKYNENAVEVYKMEKKKEGKIHATKALTFPKSHETDEIIAMGIASNGKFIMTCSNKTDMIIWDLKGQILAHIDTYLMNTICAKISPCGKFVVASGFTPEAKIWEIIFDKTGEFQEVKQIPQLALGGHSSGIYDVAFDVDSSHMATVSKDGTWRLFDTKVHYQLGEDARLIRTGKYDQPGGKKSESPDSTSNRGREKNHALIALSPNAEVLAIAPSSNLAFYSTLTGELDYTIEDIFSDLGSHCDIRSIMFDPSGKYILVGGGKQIKVFHNITGYRCAIETAKIKLKDHQTSATKERLQKLIADNNEFLDNMKKA